MEEDIGGGKGPHWAVEPEIKMMMMMIMVPYIIIQKAAILISRSLQ